MRDVKVRFAYKTGFRRLWLALSLLWALTIIVIVIRDHDIAPLEGLLIVLAPSGALYLLGAALVWIIEGFARADQ